MKRMFCLIVLAVVLHGATWAGAQNQKAQQPGGDAKTTVGLTINDAKAYQGYTLISTMGTSKSFLIDMQGRVVRAWEGAGPPLMYASLLPNGNLLRPSMPGPMAMGGMPGAGPRIQEFNWDGELVWNCPWPSDKFMPHHDMIKLPNGNVLAIAANKKSAPEATAAGRKGGVMVDCDCLVEIRPKGKDGGEIVWVWQVWDHLIQDHDPAAANHGKVGDHPELIDVNFGGNPGAVFKAKDGDKNKGGAGNVMMGVDWTHFNGVSYNAELDQVMISVHGFSEFWIVDHSTTTAEAASHTGGKHGRGGDLLYRWGNPQAYRAGQAKDQRLFKQHNAHWIPKGLPGAGHILLFNNGPQRPDGTYSSVDELELPVNAKGGYTRQAGGAFGPDKALWSYTAEKKEEFFSPFASGVQRLANGNTLICSAATGRVFEVTPAKQIVWEYINPVNGGPGGVVVKGPAGGVDGKKGEFKKFDPKDFDPKDLDPAKDFGPKGPPMMVMAGGGGGQLFRANRYGMDFPGLAGRELKAGNKLEEIAAKENVAKNNVPDAALMKMLVERLQANGVPPEQMKMILENVQKGGPQQLRAVLERLEQGAIPGFGAQQGGLEKRVGDLEKKVDMILNELQELKRALSKGQGGGGNR